MTCCTPVRNVKGQVPHFLPDPEINPDDRDHYKPFSDVLGKETSDNDMPSGQTPSVAKVAEDQQVTNNYYLIFIFSNFINTLLCKASEAKELRLLNSHHFTIMHLLWMQILNVTSDLFK